MTNILDKISFYEKQILSETRFIESPNSYIYDMTEIEATGELTEYLKAIIYRNAELLLEMKKKIDQKRNSLSSLRPLAISNDKTTKQIEDSHQSSSENQFSDSSSKEEQSSSLKKATNTLETSLFEAETSLILKSLSHDEKVKLKLYFLKQLIELKKQIRACIFDDYTKNISDLQNQIVKCELAIEQINLVEQEESLIETETSGISNIILVPDLDNHNSYLYGDILRYIESRKEIKNVIDKIIDGYFLKTKDTKSIESNKDSKLYEYKHPNGIRVLYIVNNGYIFICSLFFKDKQKSIRINNYYEEAVSRYQASLPYMQEQMNNPDFYIEQCEYTASINSILEQGISLSKKVGE